jgi:hypothetical protein
MSCNVNCKKVVQGGLAAGVAMILIDWVTHAVILGERWMFFVQKGLVYSEPKFPYAPFSILFALGVGILLAWFYAIARDTLHPGPVAAIKIGLAIGFIAGVPGNFAMAAWCPYGKFIPFVQVIAMFAQCVIGTFVAARVYKPKTTC